MHSLRRQPFAAPNPALDRTFSNIRTEPEAPEQPLSRALGPPKTHPTQHRCCLTRFRVCHQEEQLPADATEADQAPRRIAAEAGEGVGGVQELEEAVLGSGEVRDAVLKRKMAEGSNSNLKWFFICGYCGVPHVPTVRAEEPHYPHFSFRPRKPPRGANPSPPPAWRTQSATYTEHRTRGQLVSRALSPAVSALKAFGTVTRITYRLQPSPPPLTPSTKLATAELIGAPAGSGRMVSGPNAMTALDVAPSHRLVGSPVSNDPDSRSYHRILS